MTELLSEQINKLARERDGYKTLSEQKNGEVLYLKAELYDKLCLIEALGNQVHNLQHALQEHHH